MERSEPSLVPEWLKNSGSSVGANAALHSDDHASPRGVKNKSLRNGNGPDFGRSCSSERTTSSYFRRSSSSNSSGSFRSHNVIGRNHHDRDWDKELYDLRDQDKPFFGDRRNRDFSDPLGNNPLSKFDRDGLRRSQSMISGKHGGSWPNRVATETSNVSGKNANVFLTKGSSVSGVNKKTFEKDFPSLGAEESAVTPEVGRVPSPGISAAIQSLPMGASASLGNEKWTSALAEVPATLGSNGTILPSAQQATPSSSMSVTVGSTTSLNMAEAVVQGPSRAQTTSQLSVGTQRLEELAIKQSRQLIPVKPSLPKTLVLNSSDKQKGKVGQQQLPVSTLAASYSPRGPIKPDLSKGSKLQLLKPGREKNGVTPVAKDNVSPNGSKAASSTLAASPCVSASSATRGPLPHAVPDRKPSLTVLDKQRPTSQAQSRNDFFNLVRKKSMVNTSAGADSSSTNSTSALDASPATSLSYLDYKHAETDVAPAANTPKVVEGNHSSMEKSDSTCNGDACDVQKYTSNGSKHSIISEEEEAAFLRSLGWEENDDEEGLTEEEIGAFYRDMTKYINSNPSALVHVQQKFLFGLESQIAGIDGISSGVSSSDAKP